MLFKLFCTGGRVHRQKWTESIQVWVWAPLLPCLNIGNMIGSYLNTCYISIKEEHVNIRDQMPQ